MKKKEPVGQISLQIAAHQANPSPPVGPALGQRGLNIMQFCKDFNELCKKENIEPGMPTPVVISYYADKSFSMILKKPPVPVLVKKALKLNSASKKPGTDFVGSINMDQIAEIAKIKMGDMGVDSLEAASQMVIGTCRSMGVKVV
ncbi:MAG: 50S ribosomal protein L11 [Candidatus Jidaibacter sp.]|nr:50S ribosomal protein L11 [Candidatus Jidaibacter sp.]